MSAVEDQLAITAVLARYCHTCDDGAFADLVDLFTQDGTFEYDGAVTAGRADLLAYFERVQTPERRGKHVTANTVVAPEGDRARVTSDWVFLAFDGDVLTPRLTGRYLDVLDRVDGAWKIARRQVLALRPPA